MRSDREETQLNQLVIREIRAEIARQGRNQRDVARGMGWPQAMLSRRLTGEVLVNLNEIEQIARVLRVPLIQLIGLELPVS